MPDRFEQFPIEDLIMQDRWRREEAAEPFFTEDQPCEYCGHPASKCGCDDAPDDPVCPTSPVFCPCSGNDHRTGSGAVPNLRQASTPRGLAKRRFGEDAPNEESITCGKGKILHFVAGEPHL